MGVPRSHIPSAGKTRTPPLNRTLAKHCEILRRIPVNKEFSVGLKSFAEGDAPIGRGAVAVQVREPRTGFRPGFKM